MYPERDVFDGIAVGGLLVASAQDDLLVVGICTAVLIGFLALDLVRLHVSEPEEVGE